MWEQYGDKIVGIAAKQSYTMDSDFGYHGYSVAERRSAVMSETFEVFRKTALEFDATLGVPFMAHAANKVKWQLQTNKRENAKKTDREVSLDYIENCSAPNDMEANVYLKDAIVAIKRSLAGSPTLLRYFDTLMDICHDGAAPAPPRTTTASSFWNTCTTTVWSKTAAWPWRRNRSDPQNFAASQ